MPRKHGVIGFTKSAAWICATRGIRVNDVCPGMIHTPMVDEMIAGGLGEELDKMLKTLSPYGRGWAAWKRLQMPSCGLQRCRQLRVTGQSISVDGRAMSALAMMELQIPDELTSGAASSKQLESAARLSSLLRTGERDRSGAGEENAPIAAETENTSVQ